MKYLYSLIITILFLLSVGLLPGATHAFGASQSSELIRVAINKGADLVTIDGDGVLATDDTGKPLALIFPTTFQSERSSRVQAGSSSCRLIRLAAAGQLRMNGKSYRGMLELSVQNGKLLVVNQLPLEQYLVGVINSEISSTWPMESIKAQAVIARTFAVAKRKERSKAFYHP